MEFILPRLSYLLGYPSRMPEQITLERIPRSFISPSFTDLTPQQAKSTEEAVKKVIRPSAPYQTVDGAFAHWPVERVAMAGVRFTLPFLAGSPRRKGSLWSRGHETKRIE